jgi:hypothetical protein
VKRFVVEASLFEPFEVEILGKVYVTQPMSAKLIREVNEISAQIREKKVPEMDGTVRICGLMFGVDPAELDGMDLRALTPAMEYVYAEMNAGKPKGKVAEGPVDPKK